MDLYLLKYNNYYDRIVKKEDSLVSYSAYRVSGTITNPISAVNFNPNDGVDTEQIINWDGDIPDYVVCGEGTDIISRWFVIEAIRTRSKQFRMVLKRDVIVDNYDAVINAPCFIDKATANDSDIAIFNKEPYKFNSIKQSETLLKDDVGCSWIVGYCAQNDVGIDEEATSISGTVSLPLTQELADRTVSSIASYISSFNMNYTALGNNTYDVTGTLSAVRYSYKITDASGNNYRLVASRSNNYSDYEYITSDGTTSATRMQFLKSGVLSTLTTTLQNNLLNKFETLYTSSKYDDFGTALAVYKPTNSEATLNALREEDGKVIYDSSTQKYYTVQFQRNSAVSVSTATVIQSGNLAALYNQFEAVRNNLTFNVYSIGSATADGFTVSTEMYNYNFQLIEINTNANITYDIPLSAKRQHLTDAPYDMFAIPFSNDKKFYVDTTDGSFITNSNKLINFAAAMAIVKDLSGVGWIYDVQLLPYCPLGDANIRADKNIMTRIQTSSATFPHGLIKGSGGSTVLGIIMFCTQSRFEFSISNPISITNTKIQHQTDNWRFNSPNWASSYDFDVTMNRGLEYIDVDCTYKPFSPYIHVCPRFNATGIYGYNNNDALGLICSGDFSLPMISDQWKTYEYSNKNFENQFNRQIQNMNTNYRLQMIESGANALAGVGTGAATGAIAGGRVGAVVGGALSLGGGIADQFINKAKKEESVSYATDAFNYQIDNIKSLPNTLTKVSAFNNNNKVYPFIEHFSCTQEEKNIFENLLKYNGMTINRIDTIASFIDVNEKKFVKGRIIKFNQALSEDFHLTAMIADEIMKGVFI